MKVRWGNRSVRESPSLLGQTQLRLMKGQGVLETEGSLASVHANHSPPELSLSGGPTGCHFPYHIPCSSCLSSWGSNAAVRLYP